MDNDRHINFKLLRDRILKSEPPAVAGGLTPSDQPPATAGGSDKTYWRSLEELADSPIFEEFVQREFPQQAEEWNDPVERRTFLKLMGASLALAGLSGCVIQPPEKIVPYVKQPEEEVPGQGLYFATAFSWAASQRRCSRAAMKAGQPSSKAIPIIRTIATAIQTIKDRAPLTSFRRLRS